MYSICVYRELLYVCWFWWIGIRMYSFIWNMHMKKKTHSCNQTHNTRWRWRRQQHISTRYSSLHIRNEMIIIVGFSLIAAHFILANDIFAAVAVAAFHSHIRPFVWLLIRFEHIKRFKHFTKALIRSLYICAFHSMHDYKCDRQRENE